MVKPLEQKKRQKILIGALVIVVVIIVFLWYSSSQKKSPGEEFISEGQTGPSITREKFKGIRLDFSILDNPLFKLLKTYGVLPVTPGETGRSNPFEPH